MSDRQPQINGRHQGQPVRAHGEPLRQARAAMIMLHGRGGQARDILSLAPLLERPGFAYLAPEAGGHSWYPASFLAPTAENEPDLSSALAVVADLLDQVQEAGIPPRRTILLGFSQGACLALEFAARHPRLYGGVAGLAGGLIGTDEELRRHTGSLEGTPVFLGCSDVDPFIPKERVHATAVALRDLGADVTTRLYPGLDHIINQDELDFVRAMMAALTAQPA